MRRLTSLAFLAAMGLLSACGGSPEVVYTGTDEDAAEGGYIKDPHAQSASGRDAASQYGVVTKSNRVDIPVQEFVQISSEAGLYAFKSRAQLTGGYALGGFASYRVVENFFDRVSYGQVLDGSSATWVEAAAGRDLYAGAKGFDETGGRLRRGNLNAASSQRQTSSGHTSDETAAYKVRESVSAARSESYLSGAQTRTGFEAASAERIIGIHLWKYADRNLVADAVEVTYTIVYYNTNEYDVSATEIVENVPYYTEYVQGSATLPKDGVSVEFLKRTGARNVLRWKFPKGIAAGETNKMTYKVIVRLDDTYAPREAEPERQ